MQGQSLEDIDQVDSIVSQLSIENNLNLLEALYDFDELKSRQEIVDYFEKNKDVKMSAQNVRVAKNNLVGGESFDIDLIDSRPSIDDPNKYLHELSDFGEDVYELVLDYSERVEEFTGVLESFLEKENNYAEFIYRVDEGIDSVQQVSDQTDVPYPTAARYFSQMEEQRLIEVESHTNSKQPVVTDKGREVKNFFEDVSETVEDYSASKESEPVWKRDSLS